MVGGTGGIGGIGDRSPVLRCTLGLTKNWCHGAKLTGKSGICPQNGVLEALSSDLHRRPRKKRMIDSDATAGKKERKADARIIVPFLSIRDHRQRRNVPCLPIPRQTIQFHLRHFQQSDRKSLPRMNLPKVKSSLLETRSLHNHLSDASKSKAESRFKPVPNRFWR